MKLRIEQLKEIPINFEYKEPWESFPVLQEMVSDGACRFEGSASISIQAVKELDNFRVTGKVSIDTNLTCSRCLEPLFTTVESRFTFFFHPVQSGLSMDEDEVELDESDLVSSGFSGDEIDLLPEIGEQIALSIPLKPLCSENCKGLCLECGADLNSSACNCTDAQYNYKFSALKDFKVRSK